MKPRKKKKWKDTYKFNRTKQNTQNKNKNKTPNQQKMIFFFSLLLRYEKNVLGLIHKAFGGRHVTSSTLGNLSRWERSGSQSHPSVLCLRLWFDMTVCLVTIPQAPTLSIAPAVDPCQFVQSHYDVKHGWILQKSEWLPFFPHTYWFISVVHSTSRWREGKSKWMTDFIGI